jgi:hypothetical protein
LDTLDCPAIDRGLVLARSSNQPHIAEAGEALARGGEALATPTESAPPVWSAIFCQIHSATDSAREIGSPSCRSIHRHAAELLAKPSASTRRSLSRTTAQPLVLSMTVMLVPLGG